MTVLLRFVCLLVIVCSFASVQADDEKGTLSKEEKIKRIMSLAKPAEKSRTFYRWQSETSGRTLLSEAEYTEDRFRYFMGMTIDGDHFAGGHGVYYAENITSSAKFIRGDGRGSLIEVVIPKGMPTLDLTSGATQTQLKKLGLTDHDVLSLNPPLTVRYDNHGWWALKRREGVRFRPFTADKMSIDSVIAAHARIQGYPRAVEVLEPIIEKRVDLEIARNPGALVKNPAWLPFVSNSSFLKVLAESEELRADFLRQINSGDLKAIPEKRLPLILKYFREAGVKFDEEKLVSSLSGRKLVIYLDQAYGEHALPKALVERVVADDDVLFRSHLFNQDERAKIGKWILPKLREDITPLGQRMELVDYLGSESLVELLRSSEVLRERMGQAALAGSLGGTRNFGQTLADLKAGGVEIDERSALAQASLPRQLDYLELRYPNSAPPAEYLDLVFYNQHTDTLAYSASMRSRLERFAERVSKIDPDFLLRKPSSVAHLTRERLKEIFEVRPDIAQFLRTSLVEGKMRNSTTDITRLLAALHDVGLRPDSADLFKHYTISEKVGYLEKTYKNGGIPARFWGALQDDPAIRRNQQLAPEMWQRISKLANSTLAGNPTDPELSRALSPLYSRSEIVADGKALIGLESMSSEARAAHVSYIHSFLRQPYLSKLTADEMAKVASSLFAANVNYYHSGALVEAYKLAGRHFHALSNEGRDKLEARLIRSLASAHDDEAMQALSSLARFTKLSLVGSAAVLEMCKKGEVLCEGRRSGELNIYERAARTMAESSGTDYVSSLSSCLKGSCWNERAIFEAAPPETLTLKQVTTLVEIFNAASEERRREFARAMSTVVAPHWSKMPDAFRNILEIETSRQGRFAWELDETDVVRRRRGFALFLAANDMTSSNSKKKADHQLLQLLGYELNKIRGVEDSLMMMNQDRDTQLVVQLESAVRRLHDAEKNQKAPTEIAPRAALDGAPGDPRCAGLFARIIQKIKVPFQPKSRK